MRGIDLAAKIRNTGRALGLEITQHDLKVGYAFGAVDPTLDNRPFVEWCYRASGRERALKALHESVYVARGAAVYLQQNRLCALCGKKLGPTGYEIDHIQTRAKGRDDRMENLRVVDGDCHRRRHGG